MTKETISGKVVLSTGAASGIGAGCSRHLVAAGATVIGLDIDEAAGRKIFASLVRPSGFSSSDVLDLVDGKQELDQIVERYGRIAVAVLNADVIAAHLARNCSTLPCSGSMRLLTPARRR